MRTLYTRIGKLGKVQAENTNTITNCSGVFYNCDSFTEWSKSLRDLVVGCKTFDNCSNLTTFTGNLESLVVGDEMFNDCTSLIAFNSDLSNIKSAYDMFSGCKLTPDSVQNISETINDISALDMYNDEDWQYSRDGGVTTNVIEEAQRGKIDIDWDSENYSSFSNDVIQYCRIISRKGWNISLNGEIITPYIILTEPYNKDWSVNNNLNSLTNNDALRITSVVNSEIYQDGEKIIKMNPPTSDIVDVSGGNGNGMFYGTALTSFNSNLSKLTNGSGMFYGTALTSFNSNLSKLTNGSGMFQGCKLTTDSVQNIASTINTVSSGIIDIGIGNTTPTPDEELQFSRIIDKGWTLTVNDSSFSRITHDLLKYNTYETYTELATDYPDYQADINDDGEWNRYLDNLTNGEQMFYYCTALAAFNSDLSSLTDGGNMFRGCTSLASFNSDLSSLTRGNEMFYNTALESFNSDLSSLTDGHSMFSYCTALESFNSDLSSLKYGYNMFNNCTALTSFNSDLSSLTNGEYMFSNCKLDTTSVKNIADTINTVSTKTIHISIGNQTPNTEEETSFNTIASKGWTVYVNGNSSSNIWNPTASTNLTDEEQPTPIPFYAKPIQVTEEHAKYIDANDNYYNIVGAQFIYGDDISTYGQFTSFEHAVEEISLSLGLTHKEDVEE